MTSTTRGFRCAPLWLGLITLSALACDPSDPCDPGYYELHGACYPTPEEEPDAGGDAGPIEDDDAGSDAEPPPSDPHEGFGDACEDESDCPEALICGGEMLPYCTQVNCMDDPSICPSTWTCLDTTGLSPDPNVTSICLRL